METSIEAAREALLDTITKLETVVPAQNLNEPITLNAVTPFPQVLETTFGREVSSSRTNPLVRIPDY